MGRSLGNAISHAGPHLLESTGVTVFALSFDWRILVASSAAVILLFFLCKWLPRRCKEFFIRSAMLYRLNSPAPVFSLGNDATYWFSCLVPAVALVLHFPQ